MNHEACQGFCTVWGSFSSNLAIAPEHDEPKNLQFIKKRLGVSEVFVIRMDAAPISLGGPKTHDLNPVFRDALARG